MHTHAELRALRNSTPVNAVRHVRPVLLGVALGVRAILEECSRVHSSKPEVHRQELVYGHAKESHKLYAEGMFAARRAGVRVKLKKVSQCT